MKPYWDEWAKSRGPDGGRGARQGARRARSVAAVSDRTCADGGRPARRRSGAAGRRRPVERACKWASEAALIIMLVVIGADIFTRYAAQLLVRDRRRARRLHAGRDDVRQPVGVPGQQRVPSGRAGAGAARPRAARAVGGDLRPAVVRLCAVLLWQLVTLECSSYRFGERAPTYLETPLWIPRLAMAIGVAALLLLDRAHVPRLICGASVGHRTHGS